MEPPAKRPLIRPMPDFSRIPPPAGLAIATQPLTATIFAGRRRRGWRQTVRVADLDGAASAVQADAELAREAATTGGRHRPLHVVSMVAPHEMDAAMRCKLSDWPGGWTLVEEALDSTSFAIQVLAPPLLRAAEAVEAAWAQGQPVLIHCAMGINRSCAVAALWLLRSGAAGTAAEAQRTIEAAKAAAIAGGGWPTLTNLRLRACVGLLTSAATYVAGRPCGARRCGGCHGACLQHVQGELSNKDVRCCVCAAAAEAAGCALCSMRLAVRCPHGDSVARCAAQSLKAGVAVCCVCHGRSHACDSCRERA